LVGSSFREHALGTAPVLPAEAMPPVPPAWARGRMLALAVLLLLALMALEWSSDLDVSLGIFYVFPIAAAATVLTRPQILLAACLCAFVRGQFTLGLSPVETLLRFAMATLAYSGIGLLIVEMTQRRHRMHEAYERLRIEKTMRYRAEGSLRLLADSSPAAIVTMNASGDVLSANRAAAEMLGLASIDEVTGIVIQQQVPLLASVLVRGPSDRPMRTATTSWARRSDGQVFPIHVWLSTYGDGDERCLAGIIVDSSEEVRDREREAFRHFLDYNRLLAGAVSHEIRNMCSAIRVMTSNLARQPGLAGDVDFRALEHLVDGLARIASFELRNGGAIVTSTPVDLHQVLDQLRVVIEPDWEDIDGTIDWQLENASLRVHADPHSLLQVFLNLSQNSLRAAQTAAVRRLEVLARRDGATVLVSVTDSGPGVRDAEVLFHPFRPGADGSGLGLYVSRTLVRAFGGDLRFVPTAAGCRFDVTLPHEPIATGTP
jgi:two-component system sensor kinase FixL